MAEFNEQLRQISALREKCRQCDESLYRARLRLKRTNQQLRRADEKQTVLKPDRDRELAALRAQLARLNARLTALREESEAVARQLAQVNEQRRLIEHLQQNLASIQNRIAALRLHLAELQQEPPNDEITNQIRTTEAELSRLAGVESDVTATIKTASATLHELEAGEQGQQAQQQELQRETETVRGELTATQGRLVELSQPAFQDVESVRSQSEEI